MRLFKIELFDLSSDHAQWFYLNYLLSVFHDSSPPQKQSADGAQDGANYRSTL